MSYLATTWRGLHVATQPRLMETSWVHWKTLADYCNNTWGLLVVTSVPLGYYLGSPARPSRNRIYHNAKSRDPQNQKTQPGQKEPLVSWRQEGGPADSGLMNWQRWAWGRPTTNLTSQEGYGCAPEVLATGKKRCVAAPIPLHLIIMV